MVTYARPENSDHALLVGVLVGSVMRSKQDGFLYEARVIDDDDGNHLATFEVEAPSGKYLVRVEKMDLYHSLTKCASCGSQNVFYDPGDGWCCADCHRTDADE